MHSTRNLWSATVQSVNSNTHAVSAWYCPLACRTATAVLQTLLDKKAAGRLCRCIEDAQNGLAQGACLLGWPGPCVVCRLRSSPCASPHCEGWTPASIKQARLALVSPRMLGRHFTRHAHNAEWSGHRKELIVCLLLPCTQRVCRHAGSGVRCTFQPLGPDRRPARPLRPLPARGRRRRRRGRRRVLPCRLLGRPAALARSGQPPARESGELRRPVGFCPCRRLLVPVPALHQKVWDGSVRFCKWLSHCPCLPRPP
jgi:hypothetical protein